MEIKYNVLLDGLDIGAYTRDFVCTKADGDLMVRECIYRKFLTKPLTIKLLDASRNYWLMFGGDIQQDKESPWQELTA